MTRCISFFNVFNGLALSIGALCGGFLLQYLQPLMGHKILTLILISAVLRLAVGIFMPVTIKEVRTVDHINHNELFFSVIGIRPMLDADRKTVK